MTELDIQDKIDELRKECIADNCDLSDSLAQCLEEFRQLINAVGQDDKLNAVDALVDAINDSILNKSDLRSEAIAILNSAEYDSDNDDNDSTSAMDDAGHKESDFR